MLYSTVAQLGLVALVISAAFTVAFGDRYARVATAVHVCNWGLVSALQIRHAHHIFQTAVFIVDAVSAAAAICIAFTSGYGWACGFAAFSVLAVANHLSHAVDLRVSERTFVTASYLWEVGELGCLLAAGWRGLRQRLTARRLS